VASADDSFQHISVDAGEDHRMLLWKIQENSVLMVVVDRTVSRDVYVPHIEEALEIVEQGNKCMYVCRMCLMKRFI
jgi:hypothetical protein